jgi:hypothetical protein
VPGQTQFSSRVALATLLTFAGVVIVACSGGPNEPAFLPPQATLTIEPDVTKETAIAIGTVESFTESQAEGPGIPYVGLRLTVPDESPVLRFVSPKADITIVSENARMEVAAVPCRLSAADGARVFWAQQKLTSEQYNTLQSVIVSRVYE